LLIESLDGLFGDATIDVIDKREASRTTCFAIDGEYNRRGCADG